MKLLDNLKRLILGEEDGDEETETAGSGASIRPFEPIAGKVMLVRPEVYTNVGQVAGYLCAGYLVMLDLSAIDAQGARRVVDFLSGAAYSRDGVIRQVSSRVYLLAPSTVDIVEGSRPAGEDEQFYDTAFNF